MKIWVLARIDSPVLDDPDELSRCFPEVERLGLEFAKNLHSVVGKGTVGVTGFDAETDDPEQLSKEIAQLVKGG